MRLKRVHLVRLGHFIFGDDNFGRRTADERQANRDRRQSGRETDRKQRQERDRPRRLAPVAAKVKAWGKALVLSPDLEIRAAAGKRVGTVKLREGLYLVAEVRDDVDVKGFGDIEFGIAPRILNAGAAAINQLLAPPPGFAPAQPPAATLVPGGVVPVQQPAQPGVLAALTPAMRAMLIEQGQFKHRCTGTHSNDDEASLGAWDFGGVPSNCTVCQP